MTATFSRPATKITYLEMCFAPTRTKPALSVRQVEPFSVNEFLKLYRAVGKDYYWTDKLEEGDKAVERFCADAQKTLYVLDNEKGALGFFILHEDKDKIDLAYFGLLPHALGRGLGGTLLDFAIAEAWARPGIKKLTVNTCTLDHPRALPLYLSRGFVIIEEVTQPARV